MVEVVFVSASVHRVYPHQITELREYQFHQPSLLQQPESLRRGRGEDYFVEFCGDALCRNNVNSFGISLYGGQCLIVCCKPYCAHHAQRVVAEGYVGVERCTENTLVQVVYPAKGIQQLAESVVVERHCHCVYCKVSAVLVVLQRSVLDYGFAAVVAVTLTSCTHKFYLPNCLAIMVMERGRPEILEYRHMNVRADGCCCGLGQFYPVPQTYNVDICTRPLKKIIANHSPHGIGAHAQPVGRLSHNLVNRVIKY